MSPIILLILAIAPGLFWLWYFWHRDRLEPEPRRLVAKVFFIGALVVIPAGLLEALVPKPYTAVLAAPVFEELAKFLVVFWGVYRCLQFDEPMDGIVYATAAALGFATAENVAYVLGAGAGEAAGVAIVRAILSVPGHALWGCLWGYGLGRMKFLDRKRGETFVATGLGLAMLSHALFNLGVQSLGWSSWMLLLPPLVIIVGWRLVSRRIKDALWRAPLRVGHMPPGAPGPHFPPAPVPPPPPLHVPSPPEHEQTEDS